MLGIGIQPEVCLNLFCWPDVHSMNERRRARWQQVWVRQGWCRPTRASVVSYSWWLWWLLCSCNCKQVGFDRDSFPRIPDVLGDASECESENGRRCMSMCSLIVIYTNRWVSIGNSNPLLPRTAVCRWFWSAVRNLTYSSTVVICRLSYRYTDKYTRVLGMVLSSWPVISEHRSLSLHRNRSTLFSLRNRSYGLLLRIRIVSKTLTLSLTSNTD